MDQVINISLSPSLHTNTLFVLEKLWLKLQIIFSDTTVTAKIDVNDSLIWRTTFNNRNIFTVEKDNNVIYTAHYGNILVNSQSKKYKFDNITTDVSQINITVMQVNIIDAGLYQTVKDGEVNGCCLLVVTGMILNLIKTRI